MAPICAHLDQIKIVARPNRIPGCDGCLANGTEWVHLRMCHSCGYIGCCDDSTGQHARKHAAASQHPLVRSIEPREGWSYCYVDDVTFQIGPV
jgi:CPA2 family monovalent cation:H+ antiporter-2